MRIQYAPRLETISLYFCVFVHVSCKTFGLINSFLFLFNGILICDWSL
jgi:hypothetical protein